MIDLIYCAGGNERFARIAIEHGFKYGSQLPFTVHHPLYFADQDWNNPDRGRYMQALDQHRPHVATVLDLERTAQVEEVLSWAEEAAAFVQIVVIIPKMPGTLHLIPEEIGGARVHLGYSVPTAYGGTTVPIWEFGRRPVHLLGGNPHVQMDLTRYLNVQSADGNVAQRLATERCQFWVPGTARYAKNRWWPTLQEADGEKWGHDAIYEAFRRSCHNIMKAWQQGGLK